MRVLLCGGGTAGHVNPALAIAQTILKNSPSSEIAYVTTEGGIENKLVPFRKYEIKMSGLKRKFSISNIKTLFLTIDAILKSREIIKDFKPDVIIGTGGYACYPVIIAGHYMNVKTVVHESNAKPGKALKMLESKVDKIFVNFEQTRNCFKNKSKVIHTGNPIRESFGALDKTSAKQKLDIKEKFVILCYGGSLGAKAINEGALQLIENLISEDANIRFICSSGKKEYNNMYYSLKKSKLDNLKNLEFTDYIYDIADKIACADIVICRAGAMSISEMAYCKKCAIFIPSPNVADNHQFKNAQVLNEASAAILLPESEMFNLTDIVKELLENEEKRNLYSTKINEFCKKDANKIIYNKIKEMIKEKRK